MPINSVGTYTAPNWTNGEEPALSATGELTALTDTAYTQQLEVGDIVLSVRTDYSTDYLKLDGRGFNSADYPSLVSYITSSQYKLQATQVSASKILLHDVYCYHGVWVMVGGVWTRTTSGGNKYYAPYVMTTTDLNGAWVGQRISANDYRDNRHGHVTCYNGTWAIAYGSYVYSTKDPFGSWEETQFYSGGNYYASDIACGSGTWIITGIQGLTSVPQIFISSSPKGTWTGYSPFPTAGLYDQLADPHVVYGNGTWKVARGDVFTTTTPTSTWTTDYSNVGIKFFALAYDEDNGIWFAGGARWASYLGSPKIYYESGGTWTQVNPTTNYGDIDDLQYDNGKYVAVGEWGTGGSNTSPRYKAVWFTDDITSGNWEQLSIAGTDTTIMATSCYGYNDNWCVTGYNSSSRPRIWTFNVRYDYYVPQANFDGCYGYVLGNNIASMSSITWVNGSSPYLDEDNMQEITDCAELWQKKIGDIIITYDTKANLGANWLNCDGSTVSRLDYPELVSLIHAVRGTTGNTTTLPNLAFANAYIKAL